MHEAETTKRPCEIGLIIVNYNSAHNTSQFLQDILLQDTSDCSLTIVIADNSPSESELASVRQLYGNDPRVRFERMPANLGYFGAANHALKTVWSEPRFNWLIVSNADVRVQQRGFFSKIAHLAQGGVIAPSIISGQSGLDQNPFLRHRPSLFRMKLNRVVLSSEFLFRLMQAQASVKRSMRATFRNRRSSLSNARSIYAPHGSFVLLNREYFERGGTLDVGAFLFAEEIFVAETCRRLCIPVTYMPELRVVHEEHVSMKYNPAIRSFQAAAADYCYRNFFAEPVG